MGSFKHVPHAATMPKRAEWIRERFPHVRHHATTGSQAHPVRTRIGGRIPWDFRRREPAGQLTAAALELYRARAGDIRSREAAQRAPSARAPLSDKSLALFYFVMSCYMDAIADFVDPDARDPSPSDSWRVRSKLTRRMSPDGGWEEELSPFEGDLQEAKLDERPSWRDLQERWNRRCIVQEDLRQEWGYEDDRNFRRAVLEATRLLLILRMRMSWHWSYLIQRISCRERTFAPTLDDCE
jgi:hypothetical protein